MRLEVTSDSTLTLGWEPPENDGGDAIAAFRLEWDVDPDWESTARAPHRGSRELPASGPGGGTRATISGLRAGTTYFARVSAGNRVGFGLPSFDAPAGRAPARQPPGPPAGLSAGPSPDFCRSLRLRFGPPLVPAHGLPCSGAPLGNRSALGPCPPRPGAGAAPPAADGGAPITAYELQWATEPSFAAAGAWSAALDAAAMAAGAPLDLPLGPHMGANLQPGQAYFLRVAARNAVGTGPFCARAGMNCEGEPILAVPSAACA